MHGFLSYCAARGVHTCPFTGIWPLRQLCTSLRPCSGSQILISTAAETETDGIDQAKTN